MDILFLPFMQNALAASLLASIACGIVGTLVVLNRLVFLAGGVAHAAYGGVGLAFFFGLPVLPCTLGFTLGSSVVMSTIARSYKQKADAVIGVLWAAGMAFGIILIDLTPGYNVDLMSFLFGSILTVSANDLWLMLALDTIIVGTTLALYPGLLSISFDAEYAESRGLPATMLHTILVAMAALSIVMIIRVVGLILVIALLTIPPFIAERNAKKLGAMMLTAIFWSIVFCIAGLFLAFWCNITSGASIIAIAATCFFICIAIEQIKKKYYA
ncbi:MAG: metal ABC transporter permease [Desulfovibrionales bacterium]|nr:metal ABC transporter permease [Desulfovibrionales bacterium]